MAGRLATLLHSPATTVGRAVSRFLCALLALLGAAPFLATFAFRSQAVETWLADQSQAALRAELGVEASYTLEQSLWPLSLKVKGLRVAANDGGPDALGVDEIIVRPRLLSLLSGNLEAGAVEVINPSARLIVSDGRVRNVDYRLPESKGKGGRMKRLPFSTLEVRGAKAELQVDSVSASLSVAEVELVAGPGLSLTATVKAGESRSTWVKTASAGAGLQALDYHHHEDVLCSLELRAGYDSGTLEIEHFSLEGFADLDSRPNTRPECGEEATEPEAIVSITVDDATLDLSEASSLAATGSIAARAPVWLANRFARMPQLHGSIEVQARGRYTTQSRLPEASARLIGRGLGLDEYHIAQNLAATVLTEGTQVLIPRLELTLADGKVVLHDTVVDPFAPGIPAKTRLTETSGMTFPGLMRDLGVTDHTIVDWNFGKTSISRLHGTIHPLHLDAEIESHNHGFVVYDRGWDDPARRPMIAVPTATVRGKIGVRPNALEFYDTTSSFGASAVVSELVSIGFTDHIEILVREGSVVELDDIGPLVGIPISGRMEVQARMEGAYSDPLLVGTTSVKDFVFGGFSVGNIERSVVRFRPLWVEFEELEGTKGDSTLHVPLARLEFDTEASVAVDATVRCDAMDVRDFFAMWHLDEDPRWDGIEAISQVDARVRYTLGGRNDPCGAGRLEVDGKLGLSKLLVFGEHYDTGSADFSLDWRDMDARAHGMSLALSGLTLRKGEGTLLGSFAVSPGARVTGHAVATTVSLDEIDGLGTLRSIADGSASGFLELSGSLDALEAHATASLSELHVGRSTLPASELRVSLEPVRSAEKPVGTSACGGPVYPPFDLARYAKDPVAGTFVVTGQLFGGQVRLERLIMTQQRDAHLSGTIEFNELDLGSFAGGFPTLSNGEVDLNGSLTGRMVIKDFSSREPARAEIEARIDSLWISRDALRAELLTKSAELSLASATLHFPELKVGVATPGEPATVFDVRGRLSQLDSSPRVEATLELEPFDVSRLTRMLPQVERARGQVKGALTALGPLSGVRYSGKFQLESGEFVVKGAPWAFTDLGLVVAFDEDQIRIVDGRANLGNGTLTLNGTASLDGMSPKDLRLELHARNIHAPLQPGVEGTLNADLVAAWQGDSEGSEHAALPNVTGRVDVLSFAYTRPVVMSVDIADLTRRGRRTVFESYDPTADRVRFDIQLSASRPLRISNNLLETELDVSPEGLQLQGTNQRIGLIGRLNIRPGGRLQLRNNEFEVQNGFVRFASATRIEPLVDVTATTEYRRYSDSFETAPDTNEAAGGAASATGGRWLITMRAHGDAERLKVDLSSDPILAQDDIFLLLTVGVTRAELDQSQSASVGGSVALEALGHLSGADEAVGKAIPVIDEFRFGSAYSSKAGRTEPTVTIGKRLAERIRASVTTGVAESREVRSKLEWRLSQRLSLEGTYDNVNDISSSSLGNLGGDLRWRLEFE